MMQINVSSNIDETIRQVQASAKKRPAIIAQALTKTVQLVKAAEAKAIASVFDRPTEWTKNSVFVKGATAQDQTAIVWLKDDRAARGGASPDRYLIPQIRGGVRHNKGFERALQAIGVLPQGWFIVPGKACKLDAYGNIATSVITQVLSYFRAGHVKPITDKRRAKLARGTKRTLGYEYFVGRPGNGKLPLGIWQRFTFAHGSSIKPIFIFVDHVTYRSRFQFNAIAQATFDREFSGQLNQAFAAARTT